MTKVLKRTTVASNTGSTGQEIYKVAFGVLVAASVLIGIVAFASLGVGLAKAVLILLGA